MNMESIECRLAVKEKLATDLEFVNTEVFNRVYRNLVLQFMQKIDEKANKGKSY